MGFNKIDVKKLKSNIKPHDVELILKTLGIPIFSQNNKEWVLYSGDKYIDPLNHKPKLYYYINNGVFISYTTACSYDLISLTQKRLSLLKKPCNFIDAVNFIITTTGLQTDQVQRINKPNIYDWESGLGKFIRFRQTGSALQTYDSSILDQLSPVYPQEWIDEGISIESMEKYQIRYYDRGQCTCIPCFGRDGKLYGIRVRHWLPDEIEHGKYRPLMLLDDMCYKFPTNNLFYGINYNWPEIEKSGKVTIVESEKSVLKADTWFGSGSRVLALYGSQLGMMRRNQLIKMGVKEVTLAIDSDFHEMGDDEYQVFENKVLKLASLFKGYATVYVLYNNLGLEGYKFSPFDFDKDTFNKLWANREVVLFNNDRAKLTKSLQIIS